MFKRYQAVLDSNTADVLYALKRMEEALAHQRQALATFQALATADPSNVTARNDVAISQSKIGEMLDAAGRTAESIPEFERALEIHQSLAAADPGNESFRLEIASDCNRLATVQAKLGLRSASLANHTRAVTASRELRDANSGNVELRVALALALGGRGDAYAQFARRKTAGSGPEDLAAAERDYAESVEILTKLQKENAIQGTDVQTLENNRAELEKIRKEINRR
jgi:tetratricopeptide (TPR) repeat protein